jgi:hypothetical protein
MLFDDTRIYPMLTTRLATFGNPNRFERIFQVLVLSITSFQTAGTEFLGLERECSFCLLGQRAIIHSGRFIQLRQKDLAPMIGFMALVLYLMDNFATWTTTLAAERNKAGMFDGNTRRLQHTCSRRFVLPRALRICSNASLQRYSLTDLCICGLTNR